MDTFNIKTFKFGKLKGISDETMKEHVKLYEGYVHFANCVLDTVKKLSKQKDVEGDSKRK